MNHDVCAGPLGPLLSMRCSLVKLCRDTSTNAGYPFKARTLVPGLLTLACLLVAVPVTAQVNYAVSGSTAYVTRSPNASGDIVIASTYNGYPVTSIASEAFSLCTNLTSVTIPESVTRIGNNLNSIGGAFEGCTSLTNVIIGNSVINIGFSAFFGCTSLNRMTIPASVTSIYAQAFYGCSSLTNFTFLGNAPQLVFDIEAGGAHFLGVGAGAKVYFYGGTTGWGATYGDLPTVAQQRTVEVLRPNSEDRLQPGTTFRVQWRTQGLGTNIDWSISLYTNGVRIGFPPRLATVYEGNANWRVDITVPSDLPSSCDYTLKVNDDGSEINGDSHAFCLGVPLVSLRVLQAGDRVEVCWPSRTNRSYQVQWRYALGANTCSDDDTNTWCDFGTLIAGNGGTNCVSDSTQGTARFYRLVQLP